MYCWCVKQTFGTEQFRREIDLWTARDEVAQQRGAMHQLRVDRETALARREAKRLVAQLRARGRIDHPFYDEIAVGGITCAIEHLVQNRIATMTQTVRDHLVAFAGALFRRRARHRSPHRRRRRARRLQLRRRWRRSRRRPRRRRLHCHRRCLWRRPVARSSGTRSGPSDSRPGSTPFMSTITLPPGPCDLQPPSTSTRKQTDISDFVMASPRT